MARTKNNGRSAKGSAKDGIASTSAKQAVATPADLLAKAESILSDTGDAALAVKFAERAAANSHELSKEDQIKLTEMLGLCALEMGEDDKAKAVRRSNVLCANTSGTKTDDSSAYYSTSSHAQKNPLYHFYI